MFIQVSKPPTPTFTEVCAIIHTCPNELGIKARICAMRDDERLYARLMFLLDVQERTAFRCAQPFVCIGHVIIDVQRCDVKVELTQRMRTID